MVSRQVNAADLAVGLALCEEVYIQNAGFWPIDGPFSAVVPRVFGTFFVARLVPKTIHLNGHGRLIRIEPVGHLGEQGIFEGLDRLHPFLAVGIFRVEVGNNLGILAVV